MISATITKDAFEKKMEDLSVHGFFYEYREFNDYWRPRLFKASKQLPVELVLLVGNKPHRFIVVEIRVKPTAATPAKYGGYIKTPKVCVMKCVSNHKEKQR